MGSAGMGIHIFAAAAWSMRNPEIIVTDTHLGPQQVLVAMKGYLKRTLSDLTTKVTPYHMPEASL